jgi:hypothetical protein
MVSKPQIRFKGPACQRDFASDLFKLMCSARRDNAAIEPETGFEMAYRNHLKNRILVQDRGGAEFKTASNLMVVEDLKRGTNKDIEPKDIFEMASTCILLPDTWR